MLEEYCKASEHGRIHETCGRSVQASLTRKNQSPLNNCYQIQGLVGRYCGISAHGGHNWGSNSRDRCLAETFLEIFSEIRGG